MASTLYQLIGGASWPIVRGLYRLRSQGVEHLPEGGFVLAANHTSNFDPWPLAMPLWPDRFLRFMAKSELFWWPLRVFIQSGGGFPVRRGERDSHQDPHRRRPPGAAFQGRRAV